MRVAPVLALALFQIVAASDDVEFQDTPLLTSIWQAISSKDNEAIDRLFDSTSFAVTSRASDGRGPLFWAWEYQNHYALGAIIAYGGDVLSTDEDLQGATAVSMCDTNPDCKKDDILEAAKAEVDDIKKRKEEREKQAEELDSDADFDDSSGGDDDEF